MIRLAHLGILNGLLSVVAVFQNLYYWQHLPQRVATHFGGNGIADLYPSDASHEYSSVEPHGRRVQKSKNNY